MNKIIFVIIACCGLLFTQIVYGYSKVCYVAYDFSGNGDNRMAYPLREKLPFDPVHAHYTYTHGNVRGYVQLKGKDLKKIRTILMAYKPTTPISTSLINRVEQYNRMVSRVITDFKIGNPQATIGDVLQTLKLI